MQESFKERIEKIKNGKFFKFFIIIICAIILLVTLLSIFKTKKTQTTSETNTISDYVASMERELENKLSKIEGVGKVSVMITVDGGIETVIAKEINIVTDENGITKREESPVLVGGKPLILKEVYPPVTGVLVVAKGAKNLMVMQKIQSAVITLTGVDIDKLDIIEMN